MSVTFKTVQIPSAEDQVSLEAFVYWPAESTSEPPPVIVAANGLSLTKDASLQVFAECWATEAGYASVIFDYRNLGGSDGASRNTVSLTQQHEDYRAVLRWVREQPDVFRTDRIVVMGCGVSGLAISRLAVEDRRLAGAMMMAPALDGLASWLAMPMRPRLAFWAAVDWVGSMIGCMPVFVPAVGRTGEFAVVNTPMSYTRVEDMCAKSPQPLSMRANVVNAGVACELLCERPGRHLGAARCPVLIVMPEADDVMPPSVTRSVAAQAGSKVELAVVSGGHYNIMPGGPSFDKNLAAQMPFLQRVTLQRRIDVAQALSYHSVVPSL